jgi:hypothetical protein
MVQIKHSPNAKNWQCFGLARGAFGMVWCKWRVMCGAVCRAWSFCQRLFDI